MASLETPRLLFVHAHPDDETITNGVTIAHYAARGADVRVVTCTLGEEGEVIGDRWAQLCVNHADQLGGYRIGELTAALHALGVQGPIFLGGAGRWRDSGMPGTPQRHRAKFVDADIAEQVAELAALIDGLRPHVVVTYDPNGGYGHPDHIRTHEVTTAAVEASGASSKAISASLGTSFGSRAATFGASKTDDGSEAARPSVTRNAKSERTAEILGLLMRPVTTIRASATTTRRRPARWPGWQAK